MAVEQALWYGLVQGSILAVGALGFTLLFGLLNFLNIAYAEYMTVGAYVLVLSTAMGVPIPVAAVLAFGAVAVLALVVDRTIFRAFRDRSPSTLLVVSIGLAFILRSLLRMGWGSRPRLVDLETGPALTVSTVRLLPQELAVVAVAFVVLGVTFGILHRTRLGMAIRATSEDADLARIRGVDTGRLIRYVTVLGGVIAALAGVLAGLNSQITPMIGFNLLIPIFAAVILGGIGDPRGAVAGGVSIGFAQELGGLFLASSYKPAIGLALLVVGLLVKPDGVFGTTTR